MSTLRNRRRADLECSMLRPPMGWRAWFAFPEMGLQDPTQAGMIKSMDAMANRSRLEDGVPTSLIDLGYSRTSVDGRYLACVPSNQTKCKLNCGGSTALFMTSKDGQ